MASEDPSAPDRPDAPSPDDGAAHVLVVEDDAALARWIGDYLVAHGLHASVATRGDVALELIRSDRPDAVVLDLGLPVLDGLAVCRRARAFYDGPILMLTARDDDEDEIRGLETGADDYLTKPVRPRVLLARLQALLRRGDAGAAAGGRLHAGPLEIDPARREARLDGVPLALTTQEFDVLSLLASEAGRTVDRQTLSARLRGIDDDGLGRAVDLAVSRLRRKLGDDAAAPRRIKTVRGRGYLLSVGTDDHGPR